MDINRAGCLLSLSCKLLSPIEDALLEFSALRTLPLSTRHDAGVAKQGIDGGLSTRGVCSKCRALVEITCAGQE